METTFSKEDFFHENWNRNAITLDRDFEFGFAAVVIVAPDAHPEGINQRHHNKQKSASAPSSLPRDAKSRSGQRNERHSEERHKNRD